MAELLSGVSDALLSLTVILVAAIALRGWRAERRSAREATPEQQVAQEDAKIFYALAGMQGPTILATALVGGVLKLVALALMAAKAIASAVPPG